MGGGAASIEESEIQMKVFGIIFLLCFRFSLLFLFFSPLSSPYLFALELLGQWRFRG